MEKLFVCFVALVIVGICLGASTHNPSSPGASTPKLTTPAPTTPAPTTQPPTPSTTTLSPEMQCSSKSNGTCDSCIGVKSAQCVYCTSTKKCLLKKSVIPTNECGLSDAKWAVCWLNYEALIIATSVIGGLLILGLTVCICCCCCCRGNKAASFARADAKYERERNERKAKSEERKAERKAKTDEIRRKYGLIKDDTPYTRFDES